MGVSKNRGTSTWKWMVYFMENPIKMDEWMIWGVKNPIFGNSFLYLCNLSIIRTQLYPSALPLTIPSLQTWSPRLFQEVLQSLLGTHLMKRRGPKKKWGSSTQTMHHHFSREIPQNYHTFIYIKFDSSKMGILSTSLMIALPAKSVWISFRFF